MAVTIDTVVIENPEELNVIIAQSHFIKTVEDVHETLITAIPGIKFGLAFSEASGPCLVRSSGTDQALIDLAEKNCLKVACGHTLYIFLKDCFPINVLNAVKMVQEVCHIICATANPLKVVRATEDDCSGILGVIDGYPPKGVESEEDVKARKDFLRTIGYKL